MESKKNTQTKAANAFQITLNETDNFTEIKKYLSNLKTFQYAIACKEKAPSTGHEHIHIYVQFTNTIRLSLKNLKGAHVEKCYGSAQQNIKYIKKTGEENVIWEEGLPKMKGGVTVKELKEMDKEKRDNLPAVYFNIIQKVNEQEANQMTLEDFEKKVEVVYIYGESGVGKTQKAKALIKEYFEKTGQKTFNLVKYENNFWLNVSEISEVALYDDFRDSHMKPSEFINFIDYNVHPMNIKGGCIKNKYKYIIITSVQSPNDLWKNVQERDSEPKKQWLRRMKTIYMEAPFNN